MESAINEYENLTFFFMGMKTPKERRNELGGYAFPINVGACSATFGKDKFTHDGDAFELIGSILRSCRLAPYARASRFPVGIGSDERSRWITLLTYPTYLRRRRWYATALPLFGVYAPDLRILRIRAFKAVLDTLYYEGYRMRLNAMWRVVEGFYCVGYC